MKPALIFDLDGTLVDSLRGITSSLNEALVASGLPIHSSEAVRSFIGNGARILIERSAPPNSREELTQELELTFKSHYELAWPAGTESYSGITALLELLQDRGHPLAVLSNKPHPFTVTMVERIFPTIRFASILGQRQGIPHKPDPTGAVEISKSLGLEPADCVIIGDSTMDIETARHAGMRAIAVTWGFHDHERLTESGADFLVADPAGLLAVIEALER